MLQVCDAVLTEKAVCWALVVNKTAVSDLEYDALSNRKCEGNERRHGS